MLISIIVPIYNSEKYLERCLHTLVDQTYRNLEIILIDDGSSDSSSAICQNFSAIDNRIRYFFQKNQGVSAARNLGLSNACGDYIMFVDSDDFVDKKICEALITPILNTLYTTSLCGYHFLHTKDACNITDTVVLPKINNITDMDYFKKNYGKLCSNKIFLSLWGKLFSSKVIKQNHICFDITMHIGEDLLFLQNYFQALSSIKINIVNQALYYYDVKDDLSLSSTFDLTRVQSSEYLFDHSLKFCQNMNMVKEAMPFISIYYFRTCFIIIYNILLNEGDSISKSDCHTIIEHLLHRKTTKTALSYLCNHDPEGIYYKAVFYLPDFSIKALVFFRQWIIKKIRHL